MNIVNFKVEELIPYINNPRNNDDAIDKVAASIKEFGFKVPLVIDKANIKYGLLYWNGSQFTDEDFEEYFKEENKDLN